MKWLYLLIIPIILFVGYRGWQRIFNPYGLVGIEHGCLDQLLKSPDMAGIRDFKIEKHYDWWEKTYSGSAFTGGELYKPYENPKVEMVVEFVREDGLRHNAWATCLYAIVPESGSPPQVTFDRVHIEWENVLDRQTRSWVPWHPL